MVGCFCKGAAVLGTKLLKDACELASPRSEMKRHAGRLYLIKFELAALLDDVMLHQCVFSAESM